MSSPAAGSKEENSLMAAGALSAALSDYWLATTGGRTVRVYFDVDVIRPVLHHETSEERSQLHASPSRALVAALWSAGYLGSVFLLRSHMAELHRVLYRWSKEDGQEQLPPTVPEEELSRLLELAAHADTPKGARIFDEELRRLAVPTFVRIELERRVVWQRRLAELAKDRPRGEQGSYRLLDLNHPGPMLRELSADPRMATVVGRLNERRPGLTTNNNADAEALIALAQMSERAARESSSPVVRFFTATAAIIELCTEKPEVGALVSAPGTRFRVDQPQGVLRSDDYFVWFAVLSRLHRGDSFPGLAIVDFPILWKQAAQNLRGILAGSLADKDLVTSLSQKLEQLQRSLFVGSIWMDVHGPVGRTLSATPATNPLWTRAQERRESVTQEAAVSAKNLGDLLLVAAAKQDNTGVAAAQIESQLGTGVRRTALKQLLMTHAAKITWKTVPERPWHLLGMIRWAPPPPSDVENSLAALLSAVCDPPRRDGAIEQLCDSVLRSTDSQTEWSVTVAKLWFIRAFDVMADYLKCVLQSNEGVSVSCRVLALVARLRATIDPSTAADIVRDLTRIAGTVPQDDRSTFLGLAYALYIADLKLEQGSALANETANESVDKAKRIIRPDPPDAITAMAVDHVCFVTASASLGPVDKGLLARLESYRGTEFWSFRLEDTVLFCKLVELEAALEVAGTDRGRLANDLEHVAKQYDELVRENAHSTEVVENATRARKAAQRARQPS